MAIVAAIILVFTLTSGVASARQQDERDGNGNGTVNEAKTRLEADVVDRPGGSAARPEVDDRCSREPNVQEFRLVNIASKDELDVLGYKWWCWSPRYQARIRNPETGYCLDSNWNGEAYFTSCNDGDYQGWYWSYQRLVNRATSRCLDSNSYEEIYTNPCGWQDQQGWIACPPGSQDSRCRYVKPAARPAEREIAGASTRDDHRQRGQFDLT